MGNYDKTVFFRTYFVHTMRYAVSAKSFLRN